MARGADPRDHRGRTEHVGLVREHHADPRDLPLVFIPWPVLTWLLPAYVVVALPPAPFWKNQAAYEIAFGLTWRIALASMIAYFCGEFVNSFVLAKMKIMTQGRWLWTRTIGSTLFGEGVDSLIFYPLAFYGTGIIPNDKLPLVMVAQFVTKVLVEVVFTPVTYAIVGWLKRAENEDYYDRDTKFTPFTLKV